MVCLAIRPKCKKCGREMKYNGYLWICPNCKYAERDKGRIEP